MPSRYQQIADDLRSRIDRGEFPSGTKLPAKTRLAKEYVAAVNTIAAAVRVLKDEGYVETSHGSGTYALSPSERALTVARRLQRLEDWARSMGASLD